MIRISQIKMPLTHTEEELLLKAAGIMRVRRSEILTWRIVRRSIDARKKPEIHYVYTLELTAEKEEKILRRAPAGQIQRADTQEYRFPECGERLLGKRPVIIGTGPAGLFCGYFLARHGYRPVLLERGKAAQDRKRDVDVFWKDGILQAESNVQFGEGGAGTFSDGKLNTLIKDKNGRNGEVLRLLTEFGAPGSILYDAKPHLGTDMLVRIVQNMRKEIQRYGGEVHFENKVTRLLTEDGRIAGVAVNDRERIESDVVILAIGHSARDTFRMLYEGGVPMEAKAFAVGMRVEHPRRMIHKLQYGTEADDRLPAAAYKVTAKTGGGRGVYSFCMCPGGYVVNASSEAGRLAINGMSYSGRDGENSNSAIIVTVTPADYDSGHPLAGTWFQQTLERKAYEIGQGAVPVETYGEFKESVTGEKRKASLLRETYPDFRPAIKGAWRYAPVHEILPEELNLAFVEGMEQFGRRMPGFQDSGVYVSGIESRTSSPVRIRRDDTGQSDVRGLYPCGEGAGYAGGITSAAMDGILIAEKIAQIYRPLE